MRKNIYLQNGHMIIVNGVPLADFADGDFMSIKLDGNAAARTHGGDGPAMNISTAQGGQITISLKPTSPALGTLIELRNQQQSSPTLFPITLITGVNETIVAKGCAFGEFPQFASGGPTMQKRDFLFECLQIVPDATGVESIAGGAIASLTGGILGGGL